MYKCAVLQCGKVTIPFNICTLFLVQIYCLKWFTSSSRALIPSLNEHIEGVKLGHFVISSMLQIPMERVTTKRKSYYHNILGAWFSWFIIPRDNGENLSKYHAFVSNSITVEYMLVPGLSIAHLDVIFPVPLGDKFFMWSIFRPGSVV